MIFHTLRDIGPKTLENYFAECNTRHTTHDINLSANSSLPSVFLSCTQQIVCQVSINTLQKETLGKKMLTGWHGDVDFAECTTEKHSAKFSQVCRVSGLKHSAKFLNFAECQHENTRQSFSSLPSVRRKTLGKVSQLC